MNGLSISITPLVLLLVATLPVRATPAVPLSDFSGFCRLVVDAPKKAPKPRLYSYKELRQLVIAGRLAGTSLSIERTLKQTRTHARRNLLRLLLARVLLTEEKPRRAAAELRRIRGPFSLVDYRLALLAQAESALKNYRTAHVLWRRVSQLLYSPFRHRAAFFAVDALFDAGEHRRALKGYSRLLRHYPGYPGTARVKLRIANCHEGLKGYQLAATLYSRLAFFHSGHSAAAEAQKALLRLARMGHVANPITDEERFERGKRLRYFKRWTRAIKRLSALAKRVKNKELLQAIKYELAMAFYGAEIYDKALNTFRSLVGRSVRSWLYRIYRRMGQVKRAVAMLGGDLSRAELYYADGHLKKAAKLFAKRHKKRRLTGKHLWRYAWISFRLKRYKTALLLFRALRKRNSKVSYWVARTLQELKYRKSAIAQFKKIVALRPLGYYAVQSKNRLLELGIKGGPGDQRVPKFKRINKRKGALFVWGKAGTVPRKRARISHPLAWTRRLRKHARAYGTLFPQLHRARDLYIIGFSRQARWEVQQIGLELRKLGRVKRYGGFRRLASFRYTGILDNRRRKKGVWGSEIRPLTLNRKQLKRETDRYRKIQRLGEQFKLDLIQVAQVVGEYYIQRKLAYRTSRFYRVLPHEDPLNYKRAYPTGFRALVEHYARKYRVQPYLLWSLMTIESSFNPTAISVAGARGLMQVMPKTGSLIAGRLRVVDWSTEKLLRPEVSIHFGAWYMRQLIDKFHGQEALAITSYNAGPHNVAFWLKRKGAMPLDAFIEEIPFTQARRYIKKAVRFIGIYRRLYSGVNSFYISQNLNPKFRMNINW